MIIHEYEDVTEMIVTRGGEKYVVETVILTTDIYHDDGRKDCIVHVNCIGAGTDAKEMADG